MRSCLFDVVYLFIEIARAIQVSLEVADPEMVRVMRLSVDQDQVSSSAAASSKETEYISREEIGEACKDGGDSITLRQCFPGWPIVLHIPGCATVKPLYRRRTLVLARIHGFTFEGGCHSKILGKASIRVLFGLRGMLFA